MLAGLGRDLLRGVWDRMGGRLLQQLRRRFLGPRMLGVSGLRSQRPLLGLRNHGRQRPVHLPRRMDRPAVHHASLRCAAVLGRPAAVDARRSLRASSLATWRCCNRCVCVRPLPRWRPCGGTRVEGNETRLHVRAGLTGEAVIASVSRGCRLPPAALWLVLEGLPLYTPGVPGLARNPGPSSSPQI